MISLPAWVKWGSLFVAGLIAGWTINGWRLDANIQAMKAAQAQADSQRANTVIEQIGKDADRMASAAASFASAQTALSPQIEKLKQEMRNAKPLPADCRPDADRMRGLTDAVRAANAAATGQVTGTAVPDAHTTR